jgi:predicted DNA binding CopG/RHH family protein
MLTKEDIKNVKKALDKVNSEKVSQEELIQYAVERTKGKIIK